MTIWLSEFPIEAAVLGIVVSLGYGLSGVGALPAGVLVDRFASRILITVCLLGMGTSFLLIGLAPTMLMLTFGLCLWGATAILYHPAGLSLISTGVSNSGRAFGIHGADGNVGIAFGPLLSALLLLSFNWRIVAGIVGSIEIVGAVYGLPISFDEYQNNCDSSISADEDGFTLDEFVVNAWTLFTVGFLLVLVIVTFNGLFY